MSDIAKLERWFTVWRRRPLAALGFGASAIVLLALVALLNGFFEKHGQHAATRLISAEDQVRPSRDAGTLFANANDGGGGGGGGLEGGGGGGGGGGL